MIKLLTIILLMCFFTLNGIAQNKHTELDSLLSGYSLELFKDLQHSPDHYLQEAVYHIEPERQDLKLKAIARALQLHDYHYASRTLTSLQNDPLTDQQHNLQHLLRAKLALLKNQNQQAINLLLDIPGNASNDILLLQKYLTAIAYDQKGDLISNVKLRFQLELLLAETNHHSNQDKLWQALTRLSPETIKSAFHNNNSPMEQGWLSLALIMQEYANDDEVLHAALQEWSSTYNNHPAAYYLSHQPKAKPKTFTGNTSSKTIALLLPLHGKLAQPAKHIQQGFLQAYYNHQQHNGTQPQVRIYDTTENVTHAYSLALRTNPSIIVGPLEKRGIIELNKKYRRSLPVTTLGLNYGTDEDENSNNLFQFGLSPRDEARQAAERANHDSHSNAIIITSSQTWGQQVANVFKQHWSRLGGQIVEQINAGNKTDLEETIKNVLSSYNEFTEKPDDLETTTSGEENDAEKFEHRHDVDFIFLNVEPKLARQIIPILKFNFAGDIPVYATSVVYNDNFNNINDLEGIFVCDMPWILSNNERAKRARNQIKHYEKQQIGQASRLYAFGMDAYELSMQLVKNHEISDLGIDGNTGNLYLNGENRIYRQLAWAHLVHGKAVLLD